MFILPAGMMMGADVSVGAFLWRNLAPVTLGNILGGLLVAVPYWYVYWLPSHPLGLACGKKAAKEDPATVEATVAAPAGATAPIDVAGGYPAKPQHMHVAHGYAFNPNAAPGTPMTPVAWTTTAGRQVTHVAGHHGLTLAIGTPRAGPSTPMAATGTPGATTTTTGQRRSAATTAAAMPASSPLASPADVELATVAAPAGPPRVVPPAIARLRSQLAHDAPSAT